MQGWGTVNKQEIYHSSRSRNTQRAPHTEEKPARVDLILTDTEQTPMWGTGQSAALKTEESVAQKPNPVNQDARSHLVPSISLITDIFTVFHSNHLSVKFYLTNIFPSSSGWHVSLSRLKQTLMVVICHNEFGFSQNCRGKNGRSLDTRDNGRMAPFNRERSWPWATVLPVLVILMLFITGSSP